MTDRDENEPTKGKKDNLAYDFQIPLSLTEHQKRFMFLIVKRIQNAATTQVHRPGTDTLGFTHSGQSVLGLVLLGVV